MRLPHPLTERTAMALVGEVLYAATTHGVAAFTVTGLVAASAGDARFVHLVAWTADGTERVVDPGETAVYADEAGAALAASAALRNLPSDDAPDSVE